jgi:ABC-2 type transport system ATP-binding protein
VKALDGLDLRIPGGKVCGLLGPNGAGKTTAVRILSTLIRPDAGRAIAEGTPEDLKSRVGSDRIDVVVRSAGELPVAARMVGRVCGAEPEIDRETRRISVPVMDRLSALTGTVRALDDVGVDAEDIGLRRPTLDDVFLRLTGHRAGEKEEEVAA